MAIPHCGWLSADRELNCAAKAAASVNFFVTHDAPPWWLALILTYLGMRSLHFSKLNIESYLCGLVTIVFAA